VQDGQRRIKERKLKKENQDQKGNANDKSKDLEGKVFLSVGNCPSDVRHQSNRRQ
jgi:hypothetical protein